MKNIDVKRTPLVNGFPFSGHSEALKKSRFAINNEECIPNKSFIKAREINASSISREKNGLPSVSLRPKLSLLKHDLSFIYPFETLPVGSLNFSCQRRTSERLDKQKFIEVMDQYKNPLLLNGPGPTSLEMKGNSAF